MLEALPAQRHHPGGLVQRQRQGRPTWRLRYLGAAQVRVPSWRLNRGIRITFRALCFCKLPCMCFRKKMLLAIQLAITQAASRGRLDIDHVVSMMAVVHCVWSRAWPDMNPISLVMQPEELPSLSESHNETSRQSSCECGAFAAMRAPKNP